jgi:hypothetical protein
VRVVAEPDAGGAEERTEPYSVDVRSSDSGWSVAIVQGGTDISIRACRNEAEARTYASTVRQHLAWLSASTFRAYYGLDQEA